MKVRHLRACASALAIGCALFSWEAALAAEDEVEQIQQNQADDDQEEDVITVVGSLIPTALEDAPKAVEVFTSQDLIEQGAPSMNEFLRNLTVNQSTGDLGEANPDLGAVGSGFNRVNLRGLGPNATLTLVNGRRLSSTNGGAGADINTVPTGLLGQVQVLRGGATTQYGAGAVAGAFNLVTRRDIDAPEIDFERTFYDGSNGAYKIDFRTGWVGDGGNLVLSLTHEEEDSMLATERDFSSLPFAVNPEGWNFTIGSNPGLFRVMSERASSFPFAVQDYTTLADAVNLNSGRVLDTLNPSADCATLGGFLVADEPFLAGEDLQEICAYPEAAVNDLVSELVRDQAYGEWNSQISPTLELHFDALYSKSQTTSLSEGSGSPTNRAVSESNLDGDPWLECGQGTIMFGPFVIPVGDPIGCRYFVPTEVAYYDADGSAIAGRTRNPFIDDFATRTGQVVYDGGGVFTTDEYTPFLFSGHPLYGGGLRRAVTQRERFLMNVGARGTFDSSGFLGRFLNGVNYNYNAQYNQYLQTTSAPRIIASRFNDALHGYGGPGCQAQDLVPTDQSSAGAFNATNGIQSDVAPGTQGCEFFNPFSSAFPTSVINGADNPNYGGAGFENSRGLVDWMTGYRTTERQIQAVTVNLDWNGVVPDTMFTLPGGPIAWAASTEWRVNEDRDLSYDPDPLREDFHRQPCVYGDQAVGDLTCSAPGGAYYDTGRVTRPDQTDSQAIAFFGELQLPVTEYLVFNVGARHESYNGGKVSGDTFSFSGKWDITDNIYLRGSYDTGFRADEALDFRPGTSEISVATTNFLGISSQYVLDEMVAADLGPENDVTINVGVGYQGEVLGGSLRASVDFSENSIEDEVTSITPLTIFIEVFDAFGGDVDNCSTGLEVFIEWSGGAPCTIGFTGDNVERITATTLNAGGFITNGLEYDASYIHPLFDGDLSLGFRATNTAVYKGRTTTVGSVVVQEATDLLGTDASGFIGGSPSPQWRANATVGWRNDEHNLLLRANYVDGVVDNSPDASISTYGLGADYYLDYDFNYIFTPEFLNGVELRGSVLNLTDEAPPASQSTFGYSFIAGNPRGRRIEIGVTKRF